MTNYTLSHLERLEAESVYILRETAAQFKNPVLLFSGGKDSLVLLRLAEKAFRPAKFPFPIMLIDTGHNFPETYDFIERRIQSLGEKFIVKRVQDSIDSGRVEEKKGPNSSRNSLQSVTLMDALSEGKYDAAIGGARRDEEKARAKERIFSFRDEFGQWDPKNQRPELWYLLNGKINENEQIRVFPLSNWTELDIWQYVAKENLEVPSIYFSHSRDCVRRGGVILAFSPYLNFLEGEVVERLQVRFRTVGDMTCTGAFESDAKDIESIIREILVTRISERGTRLDDKISKSSMEDRKREGYF